MPAIRIAIADAQYLVRVGMFHILENQPDMCIIGEASDKEELFGVLLEQRPDVLVFDYNKAGKLDKEDLQQAFALLPEINVVVVSADSDRASVMEVLSMGVRVFLTKECDEEEIIEAIHASMGKNRFFCQKIIDILQDKPKQDDCSPTPLSMREIEIVRLICTGKTSREIADELFLSTHTIFTHRKNIFKKLNIKSSSELVLYAVKIGIVERDLA